MMPLLEEDQSVLDGVDSNLSMNLCSDRDLKPDKTDVTLDTPQELLQDAQHSMTVDTQEKLASTTMDGQQELAICMNAQQDQAQQEQILSMDTEQDRAMTTGAQEEGVINNMDAQQEEAITMDARQDENMAKDTQEGQTNSAKVATEMPQAGTSLSADSSVG